VKYEQGDKLLELLREMSREEGSKLFVKHKGTSVHFNRCDFFLSSQMPSLLQLFVGVKVDSKPVLTKVRLALANMKSSQFSLSGDNGNSFLYHSNRMIE
jgi:hypothetical protein